MDDPLEWGPPGNMETNKDNPSGSVNAVTDGGVLGTREPNPSLPVLVAPTMDIEFNTIRAAIFPIACFRLEDMRFGFDSSFVQPEIRLELVHLADLIEQHTHPQLGRPVMSVFGHADPIGDEEYNKKLSGRRALAIYALLTRKAELWEELFSQPLGNDRWGDASIQIMLKRLGHYDGAITGVVDGPTRAAVRSFQASPQGGVPVDGIAGLVTRKALFTAYMEALCTVAEDKVLVLNAKTDFLARGGDAGLKGDVQGCSEFNPVLLFSRPEAEEFAKDQNKALRNSENAPNRRVMVLLFRPGVTVATGFWPCPRAKDPTADCRKRFWSDHTERLTLGPQRRRFDQTHDTFACRFYQRLLSFSPCETPAKLLPIPIVFDDPLFGFAANVAVMFTFADGSKRELKSDAKGVVMLEAPGQQFTDIEYQLNEMRQKRRVFLRPGDIASDSAVWQRLVNLGYVHESNPPAAPATPEEMTVAAQRFQAEFGLPPTGKLTPQTREAIRAAHDVDRTEWKKREWADRPAPRPGDPQPKAEVS